MEKLEVYCDGSGNTFASDGGYGFRVIDSGKVITEGSGYIPSATNNVAELTAAIEGLKAAKTYINSKVLQPGEEIKVEIVSDSQLTLGYASGKYQCKAQHLTKLYIEIRKLYKELNASVRWVRGHNGDEHNEACDKLAKQGRESKGISVSKDPAQANESGSTE